ncbi:MAG: hypothetical protein ABSC53_03165 [Bacteroidota bacterium]
MKVLGEKAGKNSLVFSKSIYVLTARGYELHNVQFVEMYHKYEGEVNEL